MAIADSILDDDSSRGRARAGGRASGGGKRHGALGSWRGHIAGAYLRHEGLLIVLLFAGYFLSPLLRSPFIADDLPASSVAGALELRRCTLGDVAREQLRAEWTRGRFVPIAALSDPYLAYYFSDVAVDKCWTLALILVNLTLFYRLLRRFNVSASTAQLGVLCLTLLFQFRLRDDPILAFHGWMQVVVCELLLSLLTLLAYLRTGQRRWLAASVLVYGAGLLTDEASYAFAPVYWALLYSHVRDWRTTLREARPYLCVTLLLVVAVTALRIYYRSEDHPVFRMHWSLPKMAKTTGLQTLAALPLSFITFCGSSLAGLWRTERLLTSWQSWLMLLGVAGLSLLLLRRMAEERPAAERLPSAAALAGLLLWILPGLFLSVSPPHQDMARIGLGYRPVYIQYFGVALLIAAGLSRLARVLPTRWRRCAYGLALVNGLIAAIAFDGNRAVVEHWRTVTDFNMRGTVEAAFRGGLGEEMPEDAVLMLTTWRSWLDLNRPEISNEFFSKCLGQRVEVVNASPGMRPVEELQAALRGRPAFALCEQCPNDHSGYVILSTLQSGAAGQKGENAASGGDVPLSARKFRVFVRDEVLNPDFFAVPHQIFGHLPGSAYGARDGRAQILDVAGLRLVRRGPDWALYEGQFPQPSDIGTLGMAGHPVLAEVHSATAPQAR